MRRRLLKERGNADILTTAVVVSEGRRKYTGKVTGFFLFPINGIRVQDVF